MRAPIGFIRRKILEEHLQGVMRLNQPEIGVGGLFELRLIPLRILTLFRMTVD